ncbi:MAG TPA: hemerythrin domain-containing protein [bacterium]|nr:hemerythrin domain-containing protein [bacterium]
MTERLTQRLVAEHPGLLARIHAIAAALASKTPASAEGAAVIRRGLATLKQELDLHASLEDDAVFSVLEPELLERGGIALTPFKEEHDEVRRHLHDLEHALGAASTGAAANLPKAAQAARDLEGTCEDHFRKEEEVVFPMAEEILTEEAWGKVDRLAEAITASGFTR